MAKDFYWPNVTLAMHMDGADNGTVFTDVKGKTVTRNGDTKTVAGVKKFGTASAYFDGTGDYLSVPDSVDLSIAGDFTLDFWMYMVATPPGAGSQIVVKNNAGFSGLNIYASSSLALVAAFSTGSGYLIVTSAASTIALNTWHHVALQKSGTSIKLFVNGVTKASGTHAGVNSTVAMQIGNSNASYPYVGHIDDFRFTKAVRYAADFAPPTEPFPESGPATVGGNILDINGNGVARTLRAYRRDTGALLGNTTSSPVTGAYSLPVDHDGEVQVVMLDDVAGTVENDQILRTTPV